MGRYMTVLMTATVVTVLSTPSAEAITGKFVKDFEHPFVGLAVFYDAKGEFSKVGTFFALSSPRVAIASWMVASSGCADQQGACLLPPGGGEARP